MYINIYNYENGKCNGKCTIPVDPMGNETFAGFFNLVPSLKLTAKVYLNMDGVEDEKWLWEKRHISRGELLV